MLEVIGLEDLQVMAVVLEANQALEITELLTQVAAAVDQEEAQTHFSMQVTEVQAL
jgi:hypothetical protein